MTSDTQPKHKTISMSIGDIKYNYVLVKTNAPKEYDYGYTIPVKSTSKERWVLIPESSFEYQTARYGSGLYFAEVEEKDNLLEYVSQEMFKRLFVE